MMTEILGMPATDWLAQQVRDNQMFVAIIGGMLLGSCMYLMRSVPKQLGRLFMLQCTVVLEAHNDTSSYEEIMGFLVRKGIVNKKTRRLSLDKEVSGAVNRIGQPDGPCFGSEGEEISNNDHLTLGPGKHIFWYRGRPFLVDHTIGEQKMRQRPRTITLRTLGRSNAVMSELVNEANRVREDALRNRLPIWTFNGMGWRLVSHKDQRDLDTVIIQSEQKKRILDDLEWFINNPDWYVNRGISYRRGYLFYGPPGTGKTSLIFALASHYKIPVYILNLGSIYGDDKLMEALNDLPDGVCVLLEDIDAANAHTSPRQMVRRKQSTMPVDRDPDEPAVEKDDRFGDGITLSGLMNALDGIASPEKMITFMTTNHPEHIEPALLRPGRIDRKEEIGYPTQDEARAMFQRFFPESPDWHAKQFSGCFDGLLTASDLQEICMAYADDPLRAIESLSERSKESAAA